MSWAGGSFGERGQCVLAPNADYMTLDGTNTWILREPGARRSVVVDPGPSIASHLDAVAEAAGEVGVVLLTHHHHDHAEAAVEFAERVGCGVRALDPAYRLGSEGLGEGDVVEVDGLEIRVVATPGHTADSLSFLLPADAGRADRRHGARPGHDRGRAPGRTARCLPGLARPAARPGRRQRAVHGVAGHGPVIDDALGVLDFYIAHRKERLEQVEAAVAVAARGSAPRGPGRRGAAAAGRRDRLPDVDPVLWGAAELSVRAQLAYLHSR